MISVLAGGFVKNGARVVTARSGGSPVQHILPTQLFDSVHAWFTLPFVQAGMRTGWLPNVEFLEGLDRLHHTLAGPLEQ